jgi:hypothetical protein
MITSGPRAFHVTRRGADTDLVDAEHQQSFKPNATNPTAAYVPQISALIRWEQGHPHLCWV